MSKEIKKYKVKKLRDKVSGIESLGWEKVEPLNDFQYPWISDKKPVMSFKGCWDDEHFFFRFDVVDENILVFHDTDKKDEVEMSDRAEIFFRINDKLSPYYCLEMDPDGRILDYEAHYYRNINKLWSWPKGQLKIITERNSASYVVQGQISITSLKDLNIWKNGVVQAGLFRGDCISLNGRKAVLEWVSWVHPETKDPDFHVPSSFGELHFVE